MGFVSFFSTQRRWTLHEHLLFQRRLRRQGVAVMSKQKSRVKVLCLGPRFFICLFLIGIQCPIITDRPPQAMRVLIHTHFFCLLGTIPQPPLNAEFILRLRVLRTLLKGTPNCRLLCRDVVVRLNKRTHLRRWGGNIHPIRRYNFPPKKGSSNFAPLYFVRILHPRFQLVCREMRRTSMEQTIPPLLLYQTKGCPETGHPFAYYL